MNASTSTMVGAALAAGLVAGGCSTLQETLSGAEKPTAAVRDARIADLAADRATLDFDVEVRNPYGFSLPMSSVAYRIVHDTTDATPFVSGRTDLGASVPARGAATVTLPAEVVFADALAVLRGVRPGALVPYAAELELTLDVPGTGPLTLPLRTTGEVPIPALPGVAVRGIEWDELSLKRTAGRLVLDVENRNAFPVDLSGFDYALSLGGTRVAETVSRQEMTFGAGETHRLEIPLSLAPIDLGLAVFSLLGGSDAGYALRGAMAFDTRFGALRLPVDEAGTLPLRR